MALLFIDGFDHYQTSDIIKKWNSKGSSAVISSGTGRRGTNSLYMNATGANSYVIKSFSAQTIVVGFAFYMIEAFSSYHFFTRIMRSGGYVAALNVNASGIIEVWGNGFTGSNSSQAITRNQFYYIEFKLTAGSSDGSYELRINGSIVASGTNKNTGASNFTDIEIGSSGGADGSPEAHYDDLYINDGTGTLNNGFIGDASVDLILPNGAGSHQDWTPSAGTDHAALLDEVPADTADYVSSSTVGHKETNALQNLTLSGNVKGIQVCNYVSKSDGGARTIRNLIKSGASESVGVSSTPPTSPSYTYLRSIHEIDPATSNMWTESSINAMEAGAEVVT